MPLFLHCFLSLSLSLFFSSDWISGFLLLFFFFPFQRSSVIRSRATSTNGNQIDKSVLIVFKKPHLSILVAVASVSRRFARDHTTGVKSKRSLLSRAYKSYSRKRNLRLSQISFYFFSVFFFSFFFFSFVLITALKVLCDVRNFYVFLQSRIREYLTFAFGEIEPRNRLWTAFFFLPFFSFFFLSALEHADKMQTLRQRRQ